MTTINKIKERFNNPISADYRSRGEDNEEYCVGGALCLHIGINEPFPETEVLAKYLLLKFKGMSWKRARQYAKRIIRHNDREAFSTAWGVLEEVFREYEFIN